MVYSLAHLTQMIMLGQGNERQNAFGAFSSTFEDFNKLKYANVTRKIFGDLKYSKIKKKENPNMYKFQNLKLEK